MVPEQAGMEFHVPQDPIAFRVPDVAVARRSLEKAGGAVPRWDADTGVCHMAFFSDPDGNALSCIAATPLPPDGSKPCSPTRRRVLPRLASSGHDGRALALHDLKTSTPTPSRST